MTVADVLRATSGEEHLRLTRGWAESVWEAWSDHHAAVRRWAQDALKVKHVVAVPLATAVLLLAACAAAAPAKCDDAGWDPPPALSCDEAIAAARAQYATTPGITELVVQYGGICLPNARCGPPTGDQATVVAILGSGARLYVMVAIGEDGVVQADGPQPVPAPMP